MATAQSAGAFLPFVDETLLKTDYIYILLEFTIIKLREPNFANDSPILDNFKNIIFMGVGKPDFREGQVKNRAKTGNCPIFPGTERYIFNLSLKHTGTFHATFVS